MLVESGKCKPLNMVYQVILVCQEQRIHHTTHTNYTPTPNTILVMWLSWHLEPVINGRRWSG